MRMRMRYLTFVLTGLLPAIAMGGELPRSFTLGKAMPAGAYFFAQCVKNPERAWVEEKWDGVIDTFLETGAHKDALALINSLLSEESQAEVKSTLDMVSEMISSVAWRDLAGGEMAISMGLETPLPYYIVLAKGKSGSGPGNAKSLEAILDKLADMGGIEVQKREQGAARISTVAFGPEGFGLELFSQGDVIGLALGKGKADQVLRMLSGRGEGESIVDTERFKKALAETKSPEDSVVFLDVQRLFKGIEGLVAFAAEQGEPTEENLRERKLIEKILSTFYIVDYVITTVETDGNRQLTHEVTRFQPEKMNEPLVRAFTDRKPFEKFDRFIPESASSYSLMGLIDLGLVYNTVLEFIEKEVPDGPNMLASYRASLEEIGFDPARDIFSWLSGEVITFQMPSSGGAASPFGPGGDWVFMVRLKDPKLADQKITSGLDFISRQLQAMGQSITINPAPVGADGFRSISHQMAPGVQVVFGITGDWLVIGSSGPAVSKCLEVASGKAPSIAENPRFKAEGLIPKGPVAWASFQDISTIGDDWANRLAGVAMMGPLAMLPLAAIPSGAAMMGPMQQVFGIFAKLAPVAKKIDFYSSTSSIITREGPVFRRESVMTYKRPNAGGMN